MKTSKCLLFIATAFLMTTTFAHAETCSDTSLIENAAKALFKRGAQASAAQYQSTTRTGKDRWEVDVETDGACSHPVYIDTEAGKCAPVGKPYIDEENSECS